MKPRRSRGPSASPTSTGHQLTPEELDAIPSRRTVETLGDIAESFGITVVELERQVGVTRARHVTWAKDRP
jgi:hypothetical protein